MDKKAWLSLAEFAAQNGAAGPKRICIVTPDALGATTNGGIGTACAYLAHALAGDGNDVTLLYCNSGSRETPRNWADQYLQAGIAAINASELRDERTQVFPDCRQLRMAVTVHDWLISQPRFDLVLFMDWQGSGFYAMHAKACGLAFLDTTLAVVLHSPSYWHAIYNSDTPQNPIESVLWHIERQAIAMADAVISPSRYMLEWVQERLCGLPDRSFVQPNILPGQNLPRHDQDDPITEVVFFGRLEFRKGLEQFCAAMDRLAETGNLPPKITFLGKGAWLGNEHSALYIARRAEKWRGSEVILQTQLDHKQAVSYICGPGRMAVMPSLIDNSPYTVYECLVAGTPFLARDAGGIREFLPDEEAGRFLFGDNPRDLAEKIAARLGKPPMRATLAFDLEQNSLAWRQGLTALANLPARKNTKEPPFISVVLTHYNRPELLEQAVTSLFNQTVDNFEVILVDDGSNREEALAYLDALEPEFARRGWKILRIQNSFAPAARNCGVKAARGEWVLFFDDDNIAMPEMVATCGIVAANRPGGSVPLMFHVFEGDGAPEKITQSSLPTGNALAYGVLQNVLGDTTSLIHKQSFWAVGGFREDYGIGHEDFELHLRLALAGEPVAVLPRPLFWYRRSKSKSSVQLDTNSQRNRLRSLRPFLERLPVQLAELAFMAHGMGKSLGIFEDPGGDPELAGIAEAYTPEAMSQVAALLAAKGYDELASQVMSTLQGESMEVAAQNFVVKAAKAARADKQEVCRALIAEYESQEMPEDGLIRLFAAILENLPQPGCHLGRDIELRLRKLERRNALANLLLVEASIKKRDKAPDYFLAALLSADAEYLAARPDVGEAVHAGGFVSGLQHFFLHHKMDKTPWPERRFFSKLLNKYPWLPGKVKAGYMRVCQFNDSNLCQAMFECLAMPDDLENP